MLYEEVKAKKDLECMQCGRMISKGSVCYLIPNSQRLICSQCNPL